MAAASSALAAQSKRSKLDYTLPAHFVTLLSRPVQAVIDELLPLPSGSNSTTSAASLALTAAGAASSTAEPFVAAFRKNTDITTEKGGAAYASTKSALVDLFFDFAPPTDPKHLQELLDKAWEQDALSTARLVFQTRSIHEGKGYKEGFWMAAGWIWEKHPRTFLANLHLLVDPTCQRERSRAKDAAKAATKAQSASVVETLDDDGEVEGPLEGLPKYPSRPHGTYDDLNDLLVLHISGQLNASLTEVPKAVDEGIVQAAHGGQFKRDREHRKAHPGQKRDRSGFKAIGTTGKQNPSLFTSQLAKCGTKEAKHQLLAKRLEDSLKSDSKFQALYCVVVDLFVQQLKADLAALDKHREFLKRSDEARNPFLGSSSPHLFGMSYAAKWVPTPGKSADRHLHIASAIAALLFPGEGFDYSRQRLQRDVLAPLRAVLKVPETKMGQGQWRIDYTKVPSRAMSRNAQNFFNHDPQGFDAYLNKVAAGKTSISGASLMPHEILMDAMSNKSPILAKMADLQWRTLIDSLKSSSKSLLQGSLAIADVSGSMGHYLGGDKKHPQPMTVCLALTLLLGEIAEAPWNGMFFTFSSEPTAEFIDPAQSLSVRTQALSQAHWEMSTNIEKVFDLIVTTATREKLSADDMVKRLFVFSDMQFDQCVKRNAGDSEHAAIKRRFTEAGYTLPEVIFWNLAPRNAGAPKPVRADQEGVSLLSGYSGAMMKYFLGQEAKKEDEDMAEAMSADWQAVEASDDGSEDDAMGGAQSGRAGTAASTGQAKQVKKRDDPMTTVMNILAAESFKGVVVVD